MIKGVLFDMDGTMLDTEPISMACWRKSAAHFDITIDDELMNNFFGKNLSGIEVILKEAYGIDEEAVKIVEGRPLEHKILFLRSWNEWGEGNYVEPDLKYGHGFLDAIKECILK